MKKQLGFAVIELIIAVVVVAGVVGVGYVVWHRHHQTVASTTTSGTTATTQSSYQSPPVTTPTAPQVKTSTDLNSALQALNQTNVSASNTDSTQLSTQAAGF